MDNPKRKAPDARRRALEMEMDGDHFRNDVVRPNDFSRGTTTKRIVKMLATRVAKKINPLERSTDLIPTSLVGAAFVMERSRILEKITVMPIVGRACWSVIVPKTLRKIQEISGSDKIAVGPANNKNIIGR